MDQKEQEVIMSPLEENSNLILSNQTLSYQFAWTLLKQWQIARIMAKDEVESTAHLALCFAAKRFDPSTGASFQTYLFHCVRGFLQKELNRCALHARAESFHNGTSPFDERLEKIQFDDVGEPSLENSFEQNDLIGHCWKLCRQLNALERHVIMGVYFEGLSLTCLSQKLGYSRTHVARIRDRALAVLREKIGG